MVGCSNPVTPGQEMPNAKFNSIYVSTPTQVWPLTPALSQDVTDYRVGLPLGTTSVVFLGQITDSSATIDLTSLTATAPDGSNLTYTQDSATGAITFTNLQDGENTVRVNLIQDGTPRTYSLVFDVSLTLSASVINPDTSVYEGATTTFMVQLTYSNGIRYTPENEVTVNYTVTPTGGATAYSSGAEGEDWSNPGTTITLLPRDSFGFVAISIQDDVIDDQNEGLTFTLTSVTENGATIPLHPTQRSTSVEILDVVTYSITAGSMNATEGGAPFTVSLQKSRDFSPDVAFSYQIQPVTSYNSADVVGVDESDYSVQESNGDGVSPLVFSMDEAGTMTLSILPTDDSLTESLEYGQVDFAFAGDIPDGVRIEAPVEPLIFSITDND